MRVVDIFVTNDEYTHDAVPVLPSGVPSGSSGTTTVVNVASIDATAYLQASSCFLAIKETSYPGTWTPQAFLDLGVGDVIYLTDNAGRSTDYLTITAMTPNIIKVNYKVDTGDGLFMYKLNNYAASHNEMTVDLGSQQNVTRVDLLGYQLMVQSLPLMEFHRIPTEGTDLVGSIDNDWYALHIKELRSDTVISNNKNANGAFAILPAHDLSSSSDDYDNKKHALNFYPIKSVSIKKQHLPKLTISLTDRIGNPAKVGRVHLWFKVHTAS